MKKQPPTDRKEVTSPAKEPNPQPAEKKQPHRPPNAWLYHVSKDNGEKPTSWRRGERRFHRPRRRASVAPLPQPLLKTRLHRCQLLPAVISSPLSFRSPHSSSVPSASSLTLPLHIAASLPHSLLLPLTLPLHIAASFPPSLLLLDCHFRSARRRFSSRRLQFLIDDVDNVKDVTGVVIHDLYSIVMVAASAVHHLAIDFRYAFLNVLTSFELLSI